MLSEIWNERYIYTNDEKDANPQSANPQLANPQSTNRQSANPQLANPQSAMICKIFDDT